ncbi:CmcI family methyltransferase [Opitutales bacterium]|nr:CmcI family methyltransferase [Opitutales bacterium]
MSDLKNFDRESIENIERMSRDQTVKKVSRDWIDKTGPYKYVYNWRWLGLPIIQLPADIVAIQEIIWEVKPTVVIETGIARGGSLLLNASQLLMLSLCEEGKASIKDQHRKCIGIDIDIRKHNKEAIEKHPLSPMITLIEGSSIDDSTFDRVKKTIKPNDRTLVILDSNHTHDHVLSELLFYSPLVSVGSYIIVHDTSIEFAPDHFFEDRDWGRSNNPLTAVNTFIANNKNFEVDKKINDKLLITSSPHGYLKRVQ